MGQETMRCEEAEVLLHKYVDQELPVQQVRSLRQHLDGCSACSALYDELVSSKAWFVPAEEPTVPEGFAARVTALAFAEGGATELAPAPVLAHLRGGAGSAQAAPAPNQPILGGADRFLMRATAVAAGLLAILGLALYSQSTTSDRNLSADEQGLERVIEEMDELNQSQPEAESKPGQPDQRNQQGSNR